MDTLINTTITQSMYLFSMVVRFILIVFTIAGFRFTVHNFGHLVRDRSKCEIIVPVANWSTSVTVYVY